MTPAEFQAWRERLGLTRAQAAAELGMSVEYIRSAETGRREISKTVELACRAVEADRAATTSRICNDD